MREREKNSSTEKEFDRNTSKTQENRSKTTDGEEEWE